MNDSYPIRPIGAFCADLCPPGSKSLTNRALLLAALAEGRSELSGVLFADDTRRMLEALETLGFTLSVEEHRKHVTLDGGGSKIPSTSADLNLGNAGTAFRFLTAACCLGPDGSEYVLDGNDRMRARPIRQLVDPLRQLGSRIEYLHQEGFPPLRIRPAKLRGGSITIPTSLSSQYTSALLMAGPACESGLAIRFDGPITSRPYIEMTLALMQRFGVQVETGEDFAALKVGTAAYRGTTYHVEPDASNSSYFLAAAALVPQSQCTIRQLGRHSLQGDVGFADVLHRMGAGLVFGSDFITVMAGAGGRLAAIDIDLNHMPDMAQTLAALALFADGETTIRNIGNLRVKETDRLAALQTELTKLGAEVRMTETDLHIRPPADGRIRPAAIDTYDDHRMAMSLAIVGLRADGIVINDPTCVNKTFPDFFEYLERLEQNA